MTDLEIFESLRPDTEPLSERDRASLRLELFGSQAPARPAAPVPDPVDIYYDLDRGLLRTPPPSARGGRRLMSIAAAVLVVVGVAAVWGTITNREPPVTPAAQQPATTTTSTPAQQAEAPVWYDTIRPLLPDGFDQIALTNATPETIAFVAFRTGTRQLLDITITLQPGTDTKDTAEPVTFSDSHGDYVEATGTTMLTTPDDRRINIRCGLRPIGGGSADPTGLLTADRDTCDADGVDDLDIDPLSRRSLAARLADEFPPDVATPTFGQPDTSPETTAVTQIVNAFTGDDRPFGTIGADGVLRLANLSTTLGEPATTELTVINGIWPPDGDHSATDTSLADHPRGHFFPYGDIAAALVVVDGTGYHITTTDLDDTHLDALGGLLQQLVAASNDTTDPATTAVPRDAVTDATVTTTILDGTPVSTVPFESSALAEALRPDERILVVNATTTGGLAGSLTRALELSGYDVAEPANTANGVTLDESILYAQPDAAGAVTDAILGVVPVPRAESLTGQPTPALTPEMIDTADIIILLGDDLAAAPWQDAPTPLIDPVGSIGRLLIVDATTTERGRQAVTTQARTLREAGVEVAGIAIGTTATEQTMLMPIGETTPWTHAIAELTGIGGLDTWSPDITSATIPDDVTAALVIGD